MVHFPQEIRDQRLFCLSLWYSLVFLLKNDY